MYELPFLAFGRVPLYQLLPVVEAGADPAVGKGRGTNRVVAESRFSCCCISLSSNDHFLVG